MSWLEVRVCAEMSAGESSAAVAVDILSARLTSCGAISITLEAADDEEVLEPPPQTTPLWTRTVLTGLFPLDADVAAIRGAFAPDVEVTVAFLGDRNWLDQWRAHAVNLQFGDRLWVLPRNVSPALQAELNTFSGAVLRLDPGLAFGSGSHPSTGLCLEWLANAELNQRSVLDYGCGSGVLAVAAVLLGAGMTVAVDHDPQALVATRDNANYNGVTLSRVGLPDALDGHTQFAVVVANILAAPLIELAPRLTKWLEPNGHLVLAGVLVSQGDAVMAAYPDIDFGEPAETEGWLCLAGCFSG